MMVGEGRKRSLNLSIDYEQGDQRLLGYRTLIADEVKADTRKLSSYDAFKKGIGEDVEQDGFRGPERALSLKNFAEQRRTFLLNHPDIKNAGN
jgi:hypothetical protein